MTTLRTKQISVVSSSTVAFTVCFAIWMMFAVIGEATEYWQFLVLGLFVGLAGGPEAALYVFIVFYLTCIVTTWWYYSRKNAEMPC